MHACAPAHDPPCSSQGGGCRAAFSHAMPEFRLSPSLAISMARTRISREAARATPV